MEHSPQCKEPQTLNLEEKKILHETKKYLAKQGQECSPQGIFLLNSAHLFKISQGKREAQFGRYQPNTSQESTCSFMHLWKPTHNVTLLLGQGQQIIPRLWW